MLDSPKSAPALLACLLISSLLLNCGLPDPASQNSVIYKPSLSGYSDGTYLYLQLQGYYPAKRHPDFEGFNVYWGPNNETAQISKRILYVSDENRLPSKSASANDGHLSLKIALLDKFTYRFTKKASALDLNDAKITTRSEKIEEKIVSKKYYFYATTVQNSKESAISAVLFLPIYTISKNNPINWNEIITINSIPLKFVSVSDSLKQIQLQNSTTEIQPAPSHNTLLSPAYYLFPKTGYSKNQYPFKSKEAFFLTYKNDTTTLGYLKIFIESFTDSKIIISSAAFKCTTNPCF